MPPGDPPDDKPSPDSLPPSIGGKYRPIRVMATGGMGVIYEVEHEGTEERLALKVLKGEASDLEPAELERFRREARVSSRVKSEHIVRVIDADVAPELGGAPFLVMDLLEGKNLAELSGEEPVAPEQVVAWLRQVARALDKAHAVGIVHRDLKPENLFLANHPEGPPSVKIVDFGVAKIRSGEERGRTITGAVVGTPLYMAPEQAEGAAERIGPATDMWSIGLTAFRLLTGREYWTASNISLLLADIVRGPIKPPSKRGARFGPAFDAWFLRSCDRDPEHRWPSVSEQVEALADALGLASGPLQRDSGPRSFAETQPAPAKRLVVGDQSVSGSVASARRAPAGSRRTLLFAVAAAAVVVALGFFVVRSGEQPQKPSPPPTPSAAPTLANEPVPTPERAAPASPPVSANAPAIASERPKFVRTRTGRSRPPAPAASSAAPAPSSTPKTLDPLGEPN